MHSLADRVCYLKTINRDIIMLFHQFCLCYSFNYSHKLNKDTVIVFNMYRGKLFPSGVKSQTNSLQYMTQWVSLHVGLNVKGSIIKLNV